MVVRLAAKIINQGLVYGACWVVVYEVGYCVDSVFRTGFVLRLVLLAIGMTSVVMVVACCILGAGVYVLFMVL